MIPKECKRLAEVDFPIAVVSKHAAREKRLGNPSTLHLWWARRPLGACRAMLLGLLLPDPCDSQCPEDFKKRAREFLSNVQGHSGPRDDDLQQALLKFIGDFANSDLSSKRTYLEVSRGLVKSAYPEENPLVVDPFAGSGSIPFEALRLGCDAFASDLNEVAYLILRVLLEDIPRNGSRLGGELRAASGTVATLAEKKLAEFYPIHTDGSVPVAYLWARTIVCESPTCGAEVPLVRSFWLCKKSNRKYAVRHKIARSEDQPPQVEFECFEPTSDGEVHVATISQAKARCLCCSAVLAPDRVRAQLRAQTGGADVLFDKIGKRIAGARLLAVITNKSGEQGRHYRSPTDSDYHHVWKATKQLYSLLSQDSQIKSPIPNESIDLDEIRRVSVPLYGASTWGDIFSQRQKLCLATYASLIRELAVSDECKRLAALAFDRLVMQLSAHCRWKPTGESMIDMFGRHAIGMVWDFLEASPGFGSQNIFRGWIEQMARFTESVDAIGLKTGQVTRGDATECHLPDEACSVWFTDPPYYDSIPYAHLADCFYVWLKRILPELSSSLTTKAGECVVDRPHRLSASSKDVKYFEQKIADAAREGRRLLSPSGCASIIFAHKTTEGWEALLTGIISGGWRITASWPIATELTTRLNARDTASLATSVHLVCRPRPENASVGDWGQVLQELPKRVGDWMERLQAEGIRGADLVFACIGPALEIFSRYSKVETAEGREVGLPEYLEKVWEVVGRTALEHVLGTAEARARNSMAGALEEDARLTALFLWTLQSTNKAEGDGQVKEEEEEYGDDEEEEEAKGKSKKTKGFSLVFDVVRRFAQPLGIHLEDWDGRIIETEKGVVRLLSVSERAKQLFGEDGAEVVADQLERSPEKVAQLTLFPDRAEGSVPEIKVKGKSQKAKVKGEAEIKTRHEATTLDRVHAAMLLQASGRTNALRALLKAELDRSPDFLRLANALSALYPSRLLKNSLEDKNLPYRDRRVAHKWAVGIET